MNTVRSLRRVSLLVAALAIVGCSKDRAGVSGPSPTPAPTTTFSVKAFLDALLQIIETKSIRKNAIDWAAFRAEVFAAAGVAQTLSDTYPAVAAAIRLLDDSQSYYQAGNGQVIGPPPVGGCAAATPTLPALPDIIGYVKVNSCDCQGSAATRFAESIQQAIRTADRAGLAGWIVDLRGNFGGNMWPMIAGIGPVLGEGIVGWIVYNDREYEREYRDGAAISFGDVFARVEAPYTLMKEQPKVAVLTDGVVASSGEAVVVFFRGRPATRSFGTPTCGHHHLQEAFSLSEGTLFLAISQHADRMKAQYKGVIDPDEVVADPGEAVNRAVAWLLSPTVD